MKGKNKKTSPTFIISGWLSQTFPVVFEISFQKFLNNFEAQEISNASNQTDRKHLFKPQSSQSVYRLDFNDFGPPRIFPLLQAALRKNGSCFGNPLQDFIFFSTVPRIGGSPGRTLNLSFSFIHVLIKTIVHDGPFLNWGLTCFIYRGKPYRILYIQEMLLKMGRYQADGG